MRSRLLLVLVTLLMVGLVAVPATAGDELPFKAKAAWVSETQVGPLCFAPEGFRTVTTEYAGSGTHLGKFVLTEVRHEDWSDYHEDGEVPFTVNAAFVAANGDELNYEVSALLIFPSAGEGDPYPCPPNPPGPPTIVSPGFDFTGGTGRFMNAEGHGMTMLTADGLRQFGWISYDASDGAG
jgi:hypothetical protein